LSAKTLFNKLFKGGMPAIIGSAFTAIVPLLGRFYLQDDHYAIWALAATLTTIFIVFDFGTSALATKLAASGQLTQPVFVRLCIIGVSAICSMAGIACLIWPYYRTISGLTSVGMLGVVFLFACIAIGTCLRCFGLVSAAVALGRGEFKRRGNIFLIGACVQASCTFLFLEIGLGIYSLGYALILSGACQAIFCTIARTKFDAVKVDQAEVTHLIWNFVKTKGLITLLGLITTQLDRWALGIVASPSLLAHYDLVNRIATIPKVALLAFGSGLVAAAHHAQSDRELKSLYRSSLSLNVGASVACAIAAGGISYYLTRNEGFLWLVFVVTIAQSINGMTIAPTMILAGIGRPQVELHYIIPLTCFSMLAYFMGVYLSNGVVLIVGWSVSMVVLSMWFLYLSGKYIVKRA